MKLASSTKALAAELGCTRRTIAAWLKRPDSPGRTATGGFNVARWRAWLAENGLGSRAASADRDPRLDPLKREKLKLQSEKIALETEAVSLQNRVARGELFSEQEVCRVIGNAYSAMIAAMRQMKHRISAQVCGLDSGAAEKVLRADMLECLRRFEIPAGMEKHAFFGPLRAQLEALHAEIREGL